jgi:hypothetical protein
LTGQGQEAGLQRFSEAGIGRRPVKPEGWEARSSSLGDTG